MLKKLAVLAALLFSTSVWGQSSPNLSGTIAPSAARTATYTSPDQNNLSYRGVAVIIDITAYTSGTWTPMIQGKDAASGKYYTILTGAALNSTGTTVLYVYPGMTPVTNVAASSALPRTWRVVLTGASTPVATFSVGVNLSN